MQLQEKIEDSETIRLRIMEEKLKLKNERRRFIGEWLNVSLGMIVNIKTVFLVNSTCMNKSP